MTNLDDKTLDEWMKHYAGELSGRDPEIWRDESRILLMLIPALRESREEVKVLREALLELMASKSISDSEFNLVSNALSWKPSEVKK